MHLKNVFCVLALSNLGFSTVAASALEGIVEVLGMPVKFVLYQAIKTPDSGGILVVERSLLEKLRARFPVPQEMRAEVLREEEFDKLFDRKVQDRRVSPIDWSKESLLVIYGPLPAPKKKYVYSLGVTYMGLKEKGEGSKNQLVIRYTFNELFKGSTVFYGGVYKLIGTPPADLSSYEVQFVREEK